jgi:hypothetical protein
MIPVMSCSCLSDEEKIKTFMDRISIDEAPVFRNCFQKTKIEYDQEKYLIKIKTGSSWAYNYLKKKKADQLLEEKFLFSDGISRKVIFELDSEFESIDTLQSIEEFLPEIRRRILLKSLKGKKIPITTATKGKRQ